MPVAYESTLGGPATAVSPTTPCPTQGGGGAYKAVAAGTGAGNVVVSAVPGRLVKIVVVTTNTAAISLYDNASTNSGTVLFTVPANAGSGTIYSLDIPTVNGIVAAQVNNSPTLIVTYY